MLPVAVFHPVAAAIVTAVALAAGVALVALLASRIRRGWRTWSTRRRDARLRRRSAGGRETVPLPQR